MKAISSAIFVFVAAVFFSASGSLLAHVDESFDYDVLIVNGRVFDGSLNSDFKADVAVKDGIIVAVERSVKGSARTVLDARGLFITPGFIDLHTHVDRGMLYPENRACLNYLRQGVTSVVVGQCGTSAWLDFEKAEDQIHRWSREGIGLNAALLVGHGSVRGIVMGMANRAPTPEELERMRQLVEEAMRQGAHGLSTGLIYTPGSFSTTDEVIELVKVIKPYGGIYHTHIRNEWDDHVEAVTEAIEIGVATGVPVHISHFKIMGDANWGNIDKACDLIEAARARGVAITADQYPYRYSNGYPYMNFIPRAIWAGADRSGLINESDFTEVFDYLRDLDLITLYKKVKAEPLLSEKIDNYLNELPRKELVSLVAGTLTNATAFRGPSNPKERMLFLQRMSDPQEAQKIREAVKVHLSEPLSPEHIVIAICVERQLEGKSLSEIARLRGKSIEDTAIELELMGALAIPLRMCEEDIEYAMRKDWVATGSDGTAPFYGIGLVHSRSYSTFLHKIKKYALERKAISLAHAIRSQTSLAAEIMHWKDRGWIKEGFNADIAVLDLKNLNTETDFTDPHRYSEGVVHLLINGVVAIEDGHYDGALPGRLIEMKK